MMSIIGVLVLLLTDDGHGERMMKMNGYRVVRKYIERCSDEDLHGLWESAKKDDSQEAMVVMHLIICEFAKRRHDKPESE